MPEFIAIDGEAFAGTYGLLADSTGRHLLNRDGIPTRQAFTFLAQLRGKGRVLVCFGLTYDANQWLKDLPRHLLMRLWQGQTVDWRGWEIEWWPGKRLRIKHEDGRGAVVYEVVGFFQCKFVAACEEWGVKLPADVPAMKSKRGGFRWAMRERVLRYCHAECAALVKLMDALAAACEGAGYVPKTWLGAGALAQTMLNAHGVADHHAHDEQLGHGRDAAPADEAIRQAYFGGRFELLRQGRFERCPKADLISAYPHAATALPSLRGARLARRRRYDPRLPYAIWRVRWTDLPGDVMPFPVRQEDRSIIYPRSGEGYYHAVELNAARTKFPGLAAGRIEVLDGWALTVRDRERPFAWLNDVYAQRARLKATGDPAQRALKLGMNSVYGKLAQGASGSRTPRFQSYYWAGLITAQTRARMLLALSRHEPPAMVSADGIFGRCNRRASASLGGWETGTWDWIFCAQPGVYEAAPGRGEHETTVKSRGFFASEVDFRALYEGWLAEGPEYVHHYHSRRFIGLGTALHRGRLDLWRTWPSEKRTIALYPQRKELLPDGTLAPCAASVDGESRPYERKLSIFDLSGADREEVAVRVQADEQPLHDEVA